MYIMQQHQALQLLHLHEFADCNAFARSHATHHPYELFAGYEGEEMDRLAHRDSNVCARSLDSTEKLLSLFVTPYHSLQLGALLSCVLLCCLGQHCMILARRLNEAAVVADCRRRRPA